MRSAILIRREPCHCRCRPGFRTVLGGRHQLERHRGHATGLRIRRRASGPAEPPRPCSAARRARPGRPAATGRGVRSRDRHPARRQRPDHGTGPSGPHRPATANCARRVVSIGRSAVETPLPAPDAATGTPAPTTGPPSRLTSAEGQPGISRPHQGRKLAGRSCPDPLGSEPPGPVASSQLAEPLSTYRRLPAPRPPRGTDDHDALRLAPAHRCSSQGHADFWHSTGLAKAGSSADLS
jgi:hypothetical protein